VGLQRCLLAGAHPASNTHERQHALAASFARRASAHLLCSAVSARVCVRCELHLRRCTACTAQLPPLHWLMWTPMRPLEQHCLCWCTGTLLVASAAAGLPPCAFAGAVPNNIGRQVDDLLQEVQAENLAMVRGWCEADLLATCLAAGAVPVRYLTAAEMLCLMFGHVAAARAFVWQPWYMWQLWYMWQPWYMLRLAHRSVLLPAR
jgi:hypothetical protein